MTKTTLQIKKKYLSLRNEKFTYAELKKKILKFYGDEKIDNLYLSFCTITDCPSTETYYHVFGDGKHYKFLGFDITKNHKIEYCNFISDEYKK